MSMIYAPPWRIADKIKQEESANMLIKRPEEIQPQTMTMPGATGVAMRLMVGRNDGAPTFSMRLFDVAPGGHTPLHQHNYEHEVLILQGQGQVVGGVDGSTIRPVQPGDVIFIPANEKHQFRNLGSSIFMFMCMIPTSYDCGNGQCMSTPGS